MTSFLRKVNQRCCEKTRAETKKAAERQKQEVGNLYAFALDHFYMLVDFGITVFLLLKFFITLDQDARRRQEEDIRREQEESEKVRYS